MVTSMKQNAISKPSFTAEDMAAAIKTAIAEPVSDAGNPPTQDKDWEGAIVTHGGGVENTLNELHNEQRRRGKQRKTVKQSTTLRLDADVLAALKATGKGWQTRVNEVLREYVDSNRQC